MHDRHEVLGELSPGRGFRLVENQELLRAPASEEPLEELEAEPTEAVSVGNAHLLYVPVKRGFQNGLGGLRHTLSLSQTAITIRYRGELRSSP